MSKSLARSATRRSALRPPARRTEPDGTSDGMCQASKHALALGRKVGSALTDSDYDFHQKTQRHMAKVAGLSSTLLAVALTDQIYNRANAPKYEGSQELAAFMAIELFEETKPNNLNEAQRDVLIFGVQTTAAEF